MAHTPMPPPARNKILKSHPCWFLPLPCPASPPALPASHGRLPLIKHLLFYLFAVFICLFAVITKYHRLGGLNNRNVLSPVSGGWKSEVKVLAGWVPSAASLLGLPTAVFSLGPHVVFPLCVSLCPKVTFLEGCQSY